MNHELKKSPGFTLIEVLVGAAVFLVIAVAAYGAFASLFKLANANQARILAVQLANEQFEIARNMPYASIGIQNGIPAGSIPGTQTLVRGGITFTVNTEVRNIDLPFDGQIGSSTHNDSSPADNKLVEVSVSCATCQNFTPVISTGNIAPKNLETASTNGALFIQVFDSNGLPVPGASVHVVDVATTTPIIIDDVTDNSGMLQIIDAPPGVNAYSIAVSKTGYSSDQTYLPGGAGNPNPTKPHATVAVQQVTQISFVIDKQSNLHITSVTPTCAAVGNFDFTMAGAKQIGAGVTKYSQNLVTSAGGILNLNSLEWDSYTITPTDGSYDLAGINPLNPISVSPNNTQNIVMTVIPKDSKGLLIAVKDSVTQLPVSGATVQVTGPASYDETQSTGVGYLDQSDWTGGSGQTAFLDPTKYWSDDGNVDTSTSTGSVVLKSVFGSYNPSGVLESSTFNTGSSSNFYSLSWIPTNQPAAAGSNSVSMQFATSPSSTPATWTFLGPDGTGGTYYTSSGAPLNSIHNGDQFVRYRMNLSTVTSTSTPNVSDVSFTYTSACLPPGQAYFSGLVSGTYTVTVSKTGYISWSGPVSVSSAWQRQDVVIGP